MNRILICDIETTGLDPQKDAAIEVAAIIYSLEHATVLGAFSTLIRHGSNEAQAINRIPPAALAADAMDPDRAWSFIAQMAKSCEAIVAHRASFDKSFSPAPLQAALPWVCSKFDIRWPKQTREGGALVPLALEHDLGVAYAHRAMTDCDLIARLFTRSVELGVDLQEMMRLAMRPKLLFQALVSFDDKELAKKIGFEWQGETKRWLKMMVPEETGALPFKVRETNL